MCAWLNIKCITSITILYRIEIDVSSISFNFYRDWCCTATDRSCTHTVVWEVPEWLHTLEHTVSISKLVESVSSWNSTNVVHSHHQEEVLLTYLKLNKTVEAIVHRDSVIVVPNLQTSRNVDEVVLQSTTLIEEHWQGVETVHIER